VRSWGTRPVVRGDGSGAVEPSVMDSSQLERRKKCEERFGRHAALQLQGRSDREKFGTDNWTDARAAFGF
jgi:hypothetical protein